MDRCCRKVPLNNYGTVTAFFLFANQMKAKLSALDPDLQNKSKSRSWQGNGIPHSSKKHAAYSVQSRGQGPPGPSSPPPPPLLPPTVPGTWPNWPPCPVRAKSPCRRGRRMVCPPGAGLRDRSNIYNIFHHI